MNDGPEHSKKILAGFEVNRAYYGAWTSKPVCGARTKQASKSGPKGAPCQRPAGWGTDHPGYGECKLHGGKVKNNTVAAYAKEAQEYVKAIMGPALDVEPMDALLWCVRLAAGEVAYATNKIEQLAEGEEVGPPVSKTYHYGGKDGDYREESEAPPELHVWIRTRRESMDRLAKYSKMALDAGIAERQLRLAEEAGEQLAVAVRSILDGLGLTVEQEKKAPELVRGALIQLEKQSQKPPLSVVSNGT